MALFRQRKWRGAVSPNVARSLNAAGPLINLKPLSNFDREESLKRIEEQVLRTAR